MNLLTIKSSGFSLCSIFPQWRIVLNWVHPLLQPLYCLQVLLQVDWTPLVEWLFLTHNWGLHWRIDRRREYISNFFSSRHFWLKCWCFPSQIIANRHPYYTYSWLIESKTRCSFLFELSLGYEAQYREPTVSNLKLGYASFSFRNAKP